MTLPPAIHGEKGKVLCFIRITRGRGPDTSALVLPFWPNAANGVHTHKKKEWESHDPQSSLTLNLIL